MTTPTTPNLNLILPDFNDGPWHDQINGNFRSIDAIIRSVLGLTALLGVYQNSTAVTTGQRYFDETTGFYYEALSGFTTMAAPNSFEAERTTYPSRWRLLDATEALEAASDAETAALAAGASATAAATSETNAATSETNAASSASTASSAASSASTSATNAATSATNAGNSATAAATSKTNAASSASAASSSQTAAATSETNAATSASNASTSATNASNSASAAATSETNAATSATNAANSESSAGTSASAAATSETNAATSEANAATSATNAATSETNAAASAANADATLALAVRGDIAQSFTPEEQGQARANIGAGFGFENKLINPLFQVDIEGNAGGTAVNAAHVVESWTAQHVSDVTTLTASRVAGDRVPYALRYTVTTGSDASISSSKYAVFATAIEGADLADAKFGTVNAKSLWVCGRIKAPTTGIYCVALRNGSANRSYVFEVACTAGAFVDFEKEVPGDTSGTWEKTNGIGLRVTFNVAMGSTWHTTADTWSSGNFLATANQANGLATNGNIFEIEDIRVSVSKPIKTEWRPYALDLAHSQRYYEIGETSYTSSTAASRYFKVVFQTTKRIAATITRVGDGPITSGTAGSTLFGTTVDGFYFYQISSTTAIGGDWTANARMI